MKDDTKAREQFAQKLEAFAKPLNRAEQLMFKEILERAGMTETEIRRLRPGKLGDSSMAARATKLDAKLFNKLMDW
jgi:hypothetical protein